MAGWADIATRYGDEGGWASIASRYLDEDSSDEMGIGGLEGAVPAPTPEEQWQM